ncbi:MAG: fumarylacetoacetate hydrolase family protein [Trueperaceae bacterium]|jgi:2-keto-4-pentenoate hydratase/2-oxohepta-3-ene-1,7-dioic acid hydratase in catechol pathway|nr:fumarylacetoacetate hydrolase family protein [Trueperaceae bacterium]
MKLARVRQEGGVRAAVVEGETFALLPEEFSDLATVIEGGVEALAAIRRSLPAADRVPFDDALLCAPLTRFKRDILCTGWNYLDHFMEGIGKREGQEVDIPKKPTFFTKGPNTVIGPREPIAYDPEVSSKWDYEAEMALVIGQAGRSIDPASALDHVWGYLLANDISQRDLQRAHGGQWLKGKSIDRTMPLGPWLVTADEIDGANVRLRCTVNGEVLQDASTSQMAFSIPTLIAELSFGMTLEPGDVLLTGTPSGVGNAREPQRFLADGDEVVVSGSGLGELRNRLVRTDLHSPAS